MRSRTGCSSRAGGNKFLALANLGDDPRTPFSNGLRSHFPNIYVADDSVPDSGATVRGDMPCPSHSRDTSLEPAVGTSGVLLRLEPIAKRFAAPQNVLALRLGIPISFGMRRGV